MRYDSYDRTRNATHAMRYRKQARFWRQASADAASRLHEARTTIANLESRLAEAERERDEARGQVAALTDGLRLVSGALGRLDQIYRADTDLGDPPVETPAWLQEAQHRAAALLTNNPTAHAQERGIDECPGYGWRLGSMSDEVIEGTIVACNDCGTEWEAVVLDGRVHWRASHTPAPKQAGEGEK